MPLRRQFFDIAPGEFVEIGNGRVTLEHKSGRRARLRVESDLPTQGPKDAAPELRRATSQPEAQPSGAASLRPPDRG